MLLDWKPSVLTSTFYIKSSYFPLFLRVGRVYLQNCTNDPFSLYSETETVYLHDLMTIQLLTLTLAP